jgi:hypothetical protein
MTTKCLRCQKGKRRPGAYCYGCRKFLQIRWAWDRRSARVVAQHKARKAA